MTESPSNRSDAYARIQDNIEKLGHLSRQSIEQAMTALETQDAEIAERVVRGDQQANELLRIIEQECLESLEQHTPKGRELRATVASLQIAAELERIGDHGKGIAKIVLGMDPSDFSGPMDRIAKMGDICQDMLTRMLEAYRNEDDALARATAAEDRNLDELDEEASSTLMMNVMTAPDTGMHCTHLMWIAYHLERIGDRATNIAERVLFVASGESTNLGPN